MRFAVFVFALVVIFAGGAGRVFAQAPSPSPYLDDMSKMLLTYEGGFAYLKHCDDFEAQIKANPFYMANAQVVVVAIAEELSRLRRDQTPEEVQAFLLGKRKIMADAAGKQIKSQGCEGEFAQVVKKHFDMFKSVPPDKVLNYIKALKENGGVPPVQKEPE